MRFRHFRKLAALGLLVFLSTGYGTASAHLVKADPQSSSPDPEGEPQRLTVGGEALLLGYINAAELPDLYLPNFSNYQNEVRKFYDAFGGSLPWVQRGKLTPQARAIIASLRNAEYNGLRPEDYDGPQWDKRLAHIEQGTAPSESELVNFDLALTVSTMRYVSDVHLGRVNPHLFHFDLEIDHTNFELSEFLIKEIVGSQDVDASLRSAEPPFPLYRRTQAALRQYIELAGRDDNEPLPLPSKAVRPGGVYAGIPRLVRLLELLGDLPEGQASWKSSDGAQIYQGVLVVGLKHFQQRHGSDPTGVIDAATVKELNVPLSRRVVQLQLTMERMRWLPHEFARPPIVVNIPEFRLHVNDEEYHWAFSMKVVVGKAYHHQTPVFASEIRSVIFRPYWDVPSSILHAELIPQVEKNPLYLVENSYEIVDKHGTVVSEGAVDPTIEGQLLSGALRVRQVPGPKNSLGLIKFDVSSPFDVYLHGTPATELFSRSRRDFSHGCIRVEDPVALAAWVLQGNPAWTEDNIRAAAAGNETIQVKLGKPIPVLILYSTAVVMEDGEVRFFDDIYGHDATLERALAQGNPVEIKEAAGR